MGTMHFVLPPDMEGPALNQLRRACFAGGQDNMPFHTQVALEPGQLRLMRKENESGCVALPWVIEGAGILMTSTATLVERTSPYPLVLELARGKVNQLRNQAAEWLLSGLNAPAALPAAIHDATMKLGRAISLSPQKESAHFAQLALAQAYGASDQLIGAFAQQVFQIRHQQQPRLDTLLGCRLSPAIPVEAVGTALREAINTACLPLTWTTVQTAEKEFRWGPHDQLLDWATGNGLHVVGGPLIDFRSGGLPSWVQSRQMSLAGIASLTCAYAAAVVKRYQGRIRTWQLTAGGNVSKLPGLGEEEMLWLMTRIAEAARQPDAGAELLIGLAQPWGEYLAGEPRHHSPFMFADTLVRSGLRLAGLDLEIVMGLWPGGTYCRDLLDVSRLIDLYGQLGVPLQITLGLPSDAGPDDMASAEMQVDAGRWGDGFTPQMQARWATAVGALAVCKPAVRSVQWVHLSDAEPHLFPACGLVDAQGNLKPALESLRQLRSGHLR
jgi:Glycosyl hydrolase family 10